MVPFFRLVIVNKDISDNSVDDPLLFFIRQIFSRKNISSKFINPIQPLLLIS